MEKAVREAVLHILQNASHMTLATVRADGFPQATAVSFVNEELSVCFGCRNESQKAANIARNPKVSASITLPFAAWEQIKGLSLGGTAKRIDASGDIERVSRLLLAKSPQSVEFAGYAIVGVTFFRIIPRIITLLDYSQGIGHSVSVDPAG
jgi:pyridoxine/pyridoxamine 5'-phosphate oxidase